jgi:hypothetical protein
MRNQIGQIRLYDQPADQGSDVAPGHLELDDICHPRAGSDLFKQVVMYKAFEPAADHFISKIFSGLIVRDAGMMAENQAEMTPLKDDLVMQVQQPGVFAPDNALMGMFHGANVKIQITSEVKATLGGRSNFSVDFNREYHVNQAF